MSPHAEGRKTSACRTDKTVEREGGTVEWKQPLRRFLALKKTPTKCKTATTPFDPRTCGILVHLNATDCRG